MIQSVHMAPVLAPRFGTGAARSANTTTPWGQASVPDPYRNPGIVPPWLRKPPVILLPVEPHAAVKAFPMIGASS
jgi:hypothetical protein